MFAPMPSVMRELRRRLRAEQSLPTFEPCLPRTADAPPVGPGWIHEIKHDGFRILAHRQGRAVRLLTRNGNDLTDRFPLAASAILALPIKSCVVDAEAIAVVWEPQYPGEPPLTLLDMLAAVARKDYDDRRRRQAQGQAKAKAEGKYLGRVEDVARNAGIASMLKTGQSWSAIQAATGCSRATIAKIAKRQDKAA
jgi:hypothetical protein